jgi:hypothetical protein
LVAGGIVLTTCKIKAREKLYGWCITAFKFYFTLFTMNIFTRLTSCRHIQIIKL